MTAIIAVHQCLFCPQTFGSATEKDDHILGHFAQETCADCNQNLIQIGSNLYTLHNTVTCIKRKTKSEEHIESCFIDETENEQQQQQCFITNTTFSGAVAEIRIKSESEEPYHQSTSLNRTIPLEMPPLVPIGSSIQYYEERTLPMESINLEEIIIKTEPVNQEDNLMNTFGKEIDRYRCNICGKSFTRSDSLRNHKIRLHSEPGTHSCKICCHIFSNEIELAKHVKVCQSKRDKCNEVRKFKDKNAIYECHLCRKQSPTHSGLLAHFRFSHSNKNKWKCDKCGLVFVSKSMLEKHQQSHMKGQRKFKCNLCGRLLKNKRTLKEHISRHNTEKLFKCLVEGCEKRFVVAQDRDKHMQTHTTKAVEQANEEQEESDWDWDLAEEQPKDACSVVTETIFENEIKKEPTFEWYSDQPQQQHVSQNVEMTSTTFVTAGLNPKTDDTLIEEVDLGDGNFQSNQQFPDGPLALSDKHQSQSKSKHKPVECDICGVILSAKSSLDRHKVLKHSAPGTHFCKHCGKTFATVDELSEHSPGCFVKQNGGPFDCNICRKTLLTRRSFRMHMQSQHNPNDKYKCHLCIAQFTQKSALENHFKKHEKEDQLTCDICGKLYSRSDILKFHKIREHSKPGTHYCTFCCRIFQTESELLVHKAICRSKKKKRDKNNKCIDKNATYECYLCCKQSPTHTALRAHFRFKHSSEAIKYKCSICKKGFSTNSVLEMHTKRHNQPLNDRKLMCTVCGKYLLSGESFRSHMRTHTGEKPYKCTFQGCEKSFRTTPNRDEHMRSHTGEKPFHCNIDGCERRFSYGVDFRRHKYKIHGIFTKKFVCSICNEIFPENAILKAHMKKHDIKP